MVPAIPKKDYVTVAREGRNIKPYPKFKGYETKNMVEKYQTKNDRLLKFQKEDTLNNTRTHFLLEQWLSGMLWTLDNETVNAGPVDAFKARLKRNF